MPDRIRDFGITGSGEPVRSYTISNSVGAAAVFLDYGAVLQSLFVPDSHGGLTDVVLGYDSIEEYETHDCFIGATVGRMANRMGGACFSLGGTTYHIPANEGPNTLHGGLRGFDKRMWRGELLDSSSVRFSRISPDGEEGFPGDLNVSVTFTLDDRCALHIVYDAVSDKDTVVNLTNHSYFDISGCGRAMENELWLNSQSYLEVDEASLPTGRKLSVEGTPFDFTVMKPIGRDIDADDPMLKIGDGYDHNYCLAGYHAAALQSAVSGIRMDTYTDMPGIQLYAASHLPTHTGKGGKLITRRCAVCLETQIYPNALNCYAFPSPILRAGEHMHSETCYRFSLI